MKTIRYVVILISMCALQCGFPFPIEGSLAQVSSEPRTLDEPASVNSLPQVQASPTNDNSQQNLIARLEKFLSGTKWRGSYTVDGKEKLISEHYEILSAKKSEFGDQWNLVARIKYGGHDTTLPLPPIEIKFAGKTPVITIDQVSIPGLGTFDARVVIRQCKYAGTWKHGKVGGFLFGTIESMSDEEKEAAKKVVQKITED